METGTLGLRQRDTFCSMLKKTKNKFFLIVLIISLNFFVLIFKNFLSSIKKQQQQQYYMGLGDGSMCSVIRVQGNAFIHAIYVNHLPLLLLSQCAYVITCIVVQVLHV